MQVWFSYLEGAPLTRLCPTGIGILISGGHCQACAAGTYKSIVGPAPCAKCEAGKYSGGLAQSSSVTCISCPNHTYSTEASTIVNHCICNLGYTGPDGQSCIACTIGQYKETNGSAACSQCAAGKYSAGIGQTSESDCSDCHAYSTSTADRSSCLCNVGYSGPGAGPCEACGDHHYKSQVGSSLCLLCPPRSHTDGLTGQAACMCYPQFYGSGTEPLVCHRCPIGAICLEDTTCALSNGTESLHNWTSVQQWDSTVQACPPAFPFPSASEPGMCYAEDSHAQASSGPCESWCTHDVGRIGCAGSDGVYKSRICSARLFQFRCHGSRYIPGNWTRKNATGAYNIVTCPTGYQHLSAAEAGADEKQECAPGIWTNTQSCPYGHEVSTSTTGREPFQRCVACGVGKECTAPPCGISSCTECASGFYKNTAGTHPCLKCPVNTYREGIHIDGCGCPPGYHDASDGSERCSVCPPHHYCPGGGNILACPHGGLSNNGSTHLTNCTCHSGFYLSIPRVEDWEQTSNNLYMDFLNTSVNGGDGSWTCRSKCVDVQCVECGFGRYSEAGVTTCTSCPQHATTLRQNSIAAIECVCEARYYQDGQSCIACPGDMMSPQASTSVENCSLSCPEHSSAVAGSTLFTSCLCHPGWTGQNGDVCQECTSGYYKNIEGNATCSPCLNGSYSSAASSACMLCPNHTSSPRASATVLDCRCNAGFSGTNGGPCVACAPGTFKAIAGPSAPMPCSAGTYSNTSGMSFCHACAPFSDSGPGSNRTTDCKCLPGYAGPHGGPCVACDRGSYKPTSGSDSCRSCASGKYLDTAAGTICIECPAQTTSLEGQGHLHNCSCIPGYTGPDGQSDCEACPIGTYKDTMGSQECHLCPPATYSGATGNDNVSLCRICPAQMSSAEGSISITACSCREGYTGMNGDACLPCVPGSYKAIRGSSKCIQCALGKYRDEAAATSCLNCPAGKYSGILGAVSSQCISCPPGKYSDIFGATTVENCASCSAGTYSPLAGSNSSAGCKPCFSGTYSESDGMWNCSLCPAGTYGSTQGARSRGKIYFSTLHTVRV